MCAMVLAMAMAMMMMLMMMMMMMMMMTIVVQRPPVLKAREVFCTCSEPKFN